MKSLIITSNVAILVWACSSTQSATPAVPEAAPQGSSTATAAAASVPATTPSGTATPSASTGVDHDAAAGTTEKLEPQADHAAHSGAAPSMTKLSYLAPEPSEGSSQSPLNIVSARTSPGKHQMKLHYKPSKEHLQNLGHTVKATYDPGSSLEFDGKSYDLVQFHFHTPSEHLIDGVTYPMEMHLVHTEHDHPERFLVIGVLFKEGQQNPLIDTLLSDVPAHEGESVDKDGLLDLRSIVKSGEGYFHYDGSLTTPPYTETVTWLVVDKAHDASAEQIGALYRLEGNNARHIQDPKTRPIDHAH